jgi:hypothetical protein
MIYCIAFNERSAFKKGRAGLYESENDMGQSETLEFTFEITCTQNKI